MKKLFIILTTAIFFFTFNNLEARAYENTTKEIYTLEKTNLYFNNNQTFSVNTIGLEENTQDNLWMGSLIYPGVGQINQKNYFSGSLYGFFASILPLSIIFSVLVPTVPAIENGTMSTNFFIIPALYIYSVLYLFSLIDSIKTSETPLINNSEPQDPFWMTSILIPGMGQIYNENYIKGFAFLFLEILIFIPVSAIASTLPKNSSSSYLNAIIPAIIMLSLHSYNVVDSFETASKSKNNKKELSPEEKALYIKNITKELERISFDSNSIKYKISF